ncbi:hypothetical protein AAA799P11_00459 [Marine Group I thaumarchaeote SCGC AAA799-P11]|uniref:Uncharacterized protein n=1 Tax=Marine Group I thaumarchaeote SCGC AAA799-P11 TaxID=1502295 RepID=A0A087S1W5_9ARCH|nr:hypothetical protein AAA799P11_00459 [Marine Group I thaumarchaeote SCGC AAA799-P11]
MHPVITEIFSNDKNADSFFLWVSNRVKEKKSLEEFFSWHLEVISEVINEIDVTKEINFLDKKEANKWAIEFLKNYDKKIRKMRNASNQIFERFHELKIEFNEIISKENKFQKESKNAMQVFLNKEELLVGKIIFSYREIWFVANQITNSDFKLGSIGKYQKWVEENYSNLKKVKDTLQHIEKEISK